MNCRKNSTAYCPVFDVGGEKTAQAWKASTMPQETIDHTGQKKCSWS